MSPTSADLRWTIPHVESKFGLALEEARRGADSQAAALGGLRAQATTLVTVGGLSATILGGIARGGHFTAWTILAVAAFVVLVALSVAVSRPMDTYTSQHPSVLVEWAESGASADEQERDLALHMENQYDENEARLNGRRRLYSAALVALPIELLFMLIDLRGK